MVRRTALRELAEKPASQRPVPRPDGPVADCDTASRVRMHISVAIRRYLRIRLRFTVCLLADSLSFAYLIYKSICEYSRDDRLLARILHPEFYHTCSFRPPQHGYGDKIGSEDRTNEWARNCISDILSHVFCSAFAGGTM